MKDFDSRQTPPSLLLRLRDARDGEAWQTFVDVYAPLIHRHCRCCGLQAADADDLTQEVLAQVARSIRGFEYCPERGRFRDWLGAVTRNKVRRFLEGRGRRRSLGDGGGGGALLAEAIAPEADGAWTARFNAHLLEVALRRIRPHFADATWRTFEGVWLADRPAAVVAVEEGIAVAEVYVAKSRVLRRLREEIALLAEDVL